MTDAAISPPLRKPPRWSALPVGEWRWWYAPLGFAASVVLMGSLGVLGLANIGGQMLQFVLYAALAIALPWALSRRAAVEHWRWMPARPWRAALVVLVLWLAYAALMEWIENRNPVAREASRAVMRGFGFGRDAGFDAGMVLCIVALAPIGEEMLFRGLIYRSLRDGLARHVPVGLAMAVGALVSAWLFATAHGGDGQDEQLWLLAGMGLVAVLAYELTGAITVPILLHSVNNTVALLHGLRRDPAVHLAQGWIEALAWSGPLLTALLVALMATLQRRRVRSPARPPT